MNKLRLFSVVSITFITLSCAVRESNKTVSPISYELKTFRKESPGCAGTDSASCASYEVTYPVFSGVSDSVSSKLQKAIEANVSMGNPEADGWTMKMVADDFTKNFEAFRKDSPELAGNWYYRANAKVETMVDTLISLSVSDEFFTGGAHGGGGKYFISINPKTNSEVTLQTFFKPGFEESLRVEAEKSFRATRELADTASLMNNGFEFPGNKFKLNDNYGFTPEGIVFVFNNYEIASYAEGPTEILIPYEKVRDWLNANPSKQ